MDDPAPPRPGAAPPGGGPPQRDPPEAAQGPGWSEVVLALGLIAGLVVLLSLNVSEPAEVVGEDDRDVSEVVLRTLVGYLAAATEVAAALVIGWGVLQALWTAALGATRGAGGDVSGTEGVRLRLGRVLALGLEFTLASDVLRTAVAPTRADILTLGAVILLRTLLNLFLEREIRQGEAREARAGRNGAAG